MSNNTTKPTSSYYGSINDPINGDDNGDEHYEDYHYNHEEADGGDEEPYHQHVKFADDELARDEEQQEDDPLKEPHHHDLLSQSTRAVISKSLFKSSYIIEPVAFIY